MFWSLYHLWTEIFKTFICILSPKAVKQFQIQSESSDIAIIPRWICVFFLLPVKCSCNQTESSWIWKIQQLWNFRSINSFFCWSERIITLYIFQRTRTILTMFCYMISVYMVLTIDGNGHTKFLSEYILEIPSGKYKCYQIQSHSHSFEIPNLKKHINTLIWW